MERSKMAQALGMEGAFPTTMGDGAYGMTYRQWLLGQVLAGMGGSKGLAHKPQARSVARDALRLVDAALEVLAES
jgi:hypothetical protein